MAKSYYLTARERMVSYGRDEINVPDLLAVMMGSHAKSSVCSEIGNLPLSRLVTMSRYDFMQYDGINQVIAHRLEAIMSFFLKASKMNIPEPKAINSPRDVAHYFDFLKYEQQEHFVVAFLNTKNHVLSRKTIFKGSLNASIVHPREIFKEAVLQSSASIIACHNHPSGDPTPSSEDITLTERLEKAGKLIGIELLDHVIIGNPKHISLKEKGYL